MTYQMLMAFRVANSIQTFAFTPVRQTDRCTIAIYFMFAQDKSNDA